MSGGWGFKYLVRGTQPGDVGSPLRTHRHRTLLLMPRLQDEASLQTGPLWGAGELLLFQGPPAARHHGAGVCLPKLRDTSS